MGIDKFLIPTLPVNQPLCHTCQHWHGDLKCDAFPQGIPTGIFTNEWDHRYPVGGDHGLLYKPRE